MNTCKTCRHKDVDKINLLLAEKKLSFRNISKQFDLNVASIYRHYCEHLPSKLALAKDAKERADAAILLDEITEGQQDMDELRGACKKSLHGENGEMKLTESNRPDAALLIRSVGQRDRSLELKAKVAQIIKEVPGAILLTDTAFIQIQAVILEAVKDNAEIRERIVNALKQLSM